MNLKEKDDLQEHAGNSGRTTDEIFPDLHRAKMAIMKQKKKLNQYCFLFLLTSCRKYGWKVKNRLPFYVGTV